MAQHRSSFTEPGTCGAGSFDWSYWSVSSRTQWNITKDFYVGLEGYYGHLNTMSKGATVNYAGLAAGAQPTGCARSTTRTSSCTACASIATSFLDDRVGSAC